ncbi:hypothetical protein [Roseimarinus sediminis]|uniref:hypothetical protein n=1 Tax=Roseimarinus sediminis TaxID=1610899 RepID=UPI003D262216
MNDYTIKNITFSKKPISVPADYRPAYKIAQICLILKHSCIGEKSSLLKLHLITWAFKSIENRQTLLAFISNSNNSDLSVWGIEPTLNRALHLAVADNFCSYQKANYKLEEKGLEFVKKIEEDGDILTDEISLLKQIGKKGITEKSIQNLTNKWTLFND